MIRRPSYASFLIRLWRDRSSNAEWIAQAQFIPSGEQQYFASLEELFTFIRDQLSDEESKDRKERG